MFEVPNAKRVKRSKLFSSFSSDDEADEAASETSISEPFKGRKSITFKQPHDNTRTTNNDQNIPDGNRNDEIPNYGFEYEFVDLQPPTPTKSKKSLPDQADTTTTTTTSKNEETDHDPKEQTYEFNLFEPTTNSTQAQTQPKRKLITLRSPTPPPIALLPNPLDPSIGRILHPRTQTHYLTSSQAANTLTTQRQQYQSTAISGPTIQLQSQNTSWPGTHLPWRVFSIPASQHHLSVSNPPSRTEECRKRARPSKKRRISIRQRMIARAQARAEGVRAEEAEREKRTRRNREKKVKRKAREKAKKLEGRGGGDGASSSEAEGEGFY